jgi:hypothetical protein
MKFGFAASHSRRRHSGECGARASKDVAVRLGTVLLATEDHEDWMTDPQEYLAAENRTKPFIRFGQVHSVAVIEQKQG